MIFILEILSAALLGGFLYRWHGGGFFSSPRWLQNLLWAIPFALAGWGCPLIYGPALAASIAGVATGHGNGQSLGHSPAGKTEKLEYLILWLKPYLPIYWYDFILLQLCAISMVSGGIIGLIAIGNFAGASILALAAALSPLAYVIGWAIHPNENGKVWWFFNVATQIGEFFTGAILYAGLAGAIL